MNTGSESVAQAREAEELDLREPPPLRTALDRDAIMERLRGASKRGRLPGFVHRGDGVFEADVFGMPYDRILRGTIDPDPSGGSVISMTTRLKRTFPGAVIVVMALVVWPGVWLTDTFMDGWRWHHQNVETWWWYLPACALAVPALWKQYKASERATRRELASLHAKLRSLLECDDAAAPSGSGE